MEDNSDGVNDTPGNEAGSEDETTNGNRQGDKHNERFDTQSWCEASVVSEWVLVWLDIAIGSNVRICLKPSKID